MVFVDAVNTSQFVTVVVAVYVHTAAILTEDDQRIVLVADEQFLLVLVVVDGTYLVVESDVPVIQVFAYNGVLQYLEFLQSASAGSFPDNALCHGCIGMYGVAEVPWVARVVVEVFHLVSLAVVIAESSVVHTYPYGTVFLPDDGSRDVELWYEDILGKVLDVARFLVQS